MGEIQAHISWVDWTHKVLIVAYNSSYQRRDLNIHENMNHGRNMKSFFLRENHIMWYHDNFRRFWPKSTRGFDQSCIFLFFDESEGRNLILHFPIGWNLICNSGFWHKSRHAMYASTLRGTSTIPTKAQIRALRWNSTFMPASRVVF